MMRALPSDSIINADAASTVVSALSDKREKAIVHFVISTVVHTIARKGVVLPERPLDMKYIVEIARSIYFERDRLIRILEEDPEQFLWGE
jgi:hypothetical protein